MDIHRFNVLTATLLLLTMNATFANTSSNIIRTNTSEGIFFENDFIQWRHDKETGWLDGAFVKNGTGKNLIVTPLKTAILCFDEQKYCPVPLEPMGSTSVKWLEDGVIIRYRLGSTWLAGQGTTSAVDVKHEIHYTPLGTANHCVTLSCQEKIPHIFSVQILSMGLADHFDMLTWRPTLEAGVGIWAQNNTPAWRALHGGKRQSDMQAYNSKRLPLSFLVMKRGCEGIEFSLGSDLDEWNAYRTAEKPSCQEFQFAYDHAMHGYRLFVAPYNLRFDGILSGTRSFHFQLALPHVRKQMAPLRLAGKIPFGASGGRPFEQRWPTANELTKMAEHGYEILRVHNDADSFRNGIFWRDADYPPYPPDEMEKMNKCLEEVHRLGMRAVPYFSLKELHPDVKEFQLFANLWARRDETDGPLLYTRYPGGIWGVQMCLKSDWYAKRLQTIQEVLEKHPFDGVYFDWCMALECFGKNHADSWHWDYPEFIQLLEQIRKICPPHAEIYLHTSNVPSLVTENLATLLLTEEVAFSSINPEMFTPHVHFMNTTSRQICNMLPAETPSEDLTRLAMCALLHHATVADASDPFQKFYKTNLPWMKTVTKYTSHHAPGEGWGGVDSPTAGMAYYENDDEVLLVFANLSEKAQLIHWNLLPLGWTGETTLPPLQITTAIRRK